MRSVICVLAILFAQLSSFAQHCGWDNAYIAIVDSRDSTSGQTIEGLRIYLADSSGQPYLFPENMRSYHPEHLFIDSDTLLFGQNLRAENEEFSEVNGPFPFGVNSYMLLVSYNNYFYKGNKAKAQVVIEDPRGRYESQLHPFSHEKIASLCTSNTIWHSQSALEGYTISVKLKRK